MVLTEKPSFAETVEEELTRDGTGAGFGKKKEYQWHLGFGISCAFSM